MDKKEQLDKEDEIMTRKIASVRVHVERAISRIKNFRILHQTFSLKSAQQLDETTTPKIFLRFVGRFVSKVKIVGMLLVYVFLPPGK